MVKELCDTFNDKRICEIKWTEEVAHSLLSRKEDV
jgi:hypothetical protein